ncbi:MAG: hypothetical protein JWR05_676 [Mucilaginibacter sp.]|nr:hypothetical protein [Mucilaginibacter sp.]
MKPYLVFKKGLRPFLLVFLCTFLVNGATFAQIGSCPANIDFEFGNFNNWQAYTGTTYAFGGTNVINVVATVPTAGVIDIIQKGTGVDPYGNFPTSAPDGSNYSVKLGNDGTGARADRVSYDFDVPATQQNFVLTYQYAIVLQDPNHSSAEQPRFTAKVFDITANAYITCGSFEYAATAALPGFKHSLGQVIYKEWTPVSINLNGYGGHKLRLEFTAADCTAGGHFGYAYIDVNNNCSELIQGTAFCPAKPNATLTGPAGYNHYEWYSADRSKLLGTGQILSIPSAGADGTSIKLDLIPFIGFGCNYTIDATLKALPGFTFNVKDPAPVCASIDLTSTQITKTSDANLVYTYWKDAAATTALPLPNALTTSGTYYIQATAPSGCTDIKPVKVEVNPLPTITITDPPTVCFSSPVDITAAGVTAGSSAGLTFTYWTNASATQPLSNPTNITLAGTYYIMGTTTSGCSVIKPVQITNYPLPVLTITNPTAVCYPLKINITKAYITTGSDANLTYTYWTDQAATIPLLSPDRLEQSGTYYIKAINNNGCEKINAVFVTINPLPELVINPPAAACYPEKVDITALSVTAGSTNIDKLTYWTDSRATIPLTTPRAVADSSVYYIKATSIYGCEVIKPVTVNIHKLPVVITANPAKVYMPNLIDLTKAEVTAGSSPKLTFTYFIDKDVLNEVSNARAINKTGIYYIKGTNIYGCYTITPVDVTVAVIPQILVPKAFTPIQLSNNRLYPFLLGIKTFKAFRVYDRWGSLVFQTNDPTPSNGWDGVYKGQIHFLDTFSWYAEGYDYVDKLIHKTGNTILLK